MNVLVTGGAGFIGHHLCERLAIEGHCVVTLDSYSTGTYIGFDSQQSRVAWHMRRDVRDQTWCVGLPVVPEAVYNLACPASPKWYQRDPVATIETCVLGMRNVLDLAKRYRIPVVQASTSEVYGSPEEHPQKETYWGHVSSLGPRSCYDEGKRAAEAMCAACQNQHGVDVRIARIFNTYGPGMRMDDGRVVPNFIVQALEGKPITVYGSGEQTRSFCYVDDTVDALIRLLKAGQRKAPVNIGNPEEVSVLDLAARIVELTGSMSKIEILPAAQDDPPRRCPDISRAQELLGWSPKVSLGEGIAKTLSHFRRHHVDRQKAEASSYQGEVYG